MWVQMNRVEPVINCIHMLITEIQPPYVTTEECVPSCQRAPEWAGQGWDDSVIGDSDSSGLRVAP